eukprot:m.136049 g.136049  ORF g.136049 m.136049 type:complete len:408 (+) comp52464_c0_seq1:73-1296(+)
MLAFHHLLGFLLLLLLVTCRASAVNRGLASCVEELLAEVSPSSLRPAKRAPPLSSRSTQIPPEEALVNRLDAVSVNLRVPAVAMTLDKPAATEAHHLQPETQRSSSYSAPVSAVIVGVGRSGTTLFTNLLASLESKPFVLMEPYQSLERLYDYLSEYGVENSLEPPRLRDLLDCSYAKVKADVLRVLWAFSCDHSPTFRAPKVRKQCKTRQLPVATFNQLCKRSRIRLIKVLRLRWLKRKTDELKLPDPILPLDVPVFHIVRHPARVLRSAALLGWYVEDNARVSLEYATKELAPFVSSPDAHATEICQQMLDNVAIIKNAKHPKAMTVRLEDLENDLVGTMEGVLWLLDIPNTAATMASFQAAVRVKSADLPLFFSPSDVTEEEMMEVTRRNPVCTQVLELFGYNL